MRYASQIWGQSHSKTFDMMQSAQNKAFSIINFKQSMELSEPLYQKLKINKYQIKQPCIFFLIGIHSMQGRTTTTRHGVTRKRNSKRLKHTGNLFRKNLQLKDVC